MRIHIRYKDILMTYTVYKSTRSYKPFHPCFRH